MPKPALETEVANAVKARILSGEGKPFACLMKELEARGFNTSDVAVRRRWNDEILIRRLKDVQPPEQKEFKFPMR